MSRLRTFLELPFHPFLFGLYAVFFLWSQNVGKVHTADVVVPTLAVLAGTAVVWGVLSLVLRSMWRGAAVTSLYSFLFFSFGHIIGSSTKSIQEAGTAPENQAFWLVVWAFIAIAALVVAAVKRPQLRTLAFTLNVVVGLLLVLTVFTIGSTKISGRREADQLATTTTAPGTTPATPPPATVAPAKPNVKKRDIYFILLDRYANPQTLAENYGHDDTAFIDGLRERGFYVALGTRAPYPKTPHSIQTTLNMEFVDLPKESSNWQLVYDKLRNPKTAQYLKTLGYKYVLMGSGYHSLVRDPAADVNIVYDPSTGPVSTEFSQVLYNSTVLAAIAQRYDIGTLDPRRVDYERATFQYQQIPAVAQMPEPTFMFSHILMTHPPYVHDANCRFLPEQKLNAIPVAEQYIEQVKCAGKKTLDLIDRLQDVPDDQKPIIVLQSDEGPGPVGWNANTKEHYDWTRSPDKTMDEKFRILNSYYLPGIPEGESGLYQNISPVNSFRRIFNLYFDAGLAYLPDRSYVFRNEVEPYVFIDVTDRVRD